MKFLCKFAEIAAELRQRHAIGEVSIRQSLHVHLYVLESLTCAIPKLNKRLNSCFDKVISLNTQWVSGIFSEKKKFKII